VYHYYPTRQPILIRETDLRIVRRLPVQGEVTAKVGDRVEPSTIVATGEQQRRPILVNVARDLGLEPGDAEDRLVREPGQAVTEGEALARRRRGLRTQTVRSPVSGTFIRFDPLMGTALIRPATQHIELPAHVSGIVEEVEITRGVTVRAFGSRFYGAFGVGQETFGVLKMVGSDRQRPLGPDQIDSRSARSVLAVGGTVNAAALTKAVQVGVRGIIAGAIEEAELASFLQAQDGTLWRVGLPEWKFPGVGAALTLVITEGFGRTPMAPQLYETLTAGDGMQVSLCGETRLAGGLSRPEVIVPSRSAGRTGEADGLPIAALEPGATVRLLDQDHLGVLATVAEEPRRQRLAGDLVLDALAVTLADGQQLRVPAANVEVLI
jgi:hypothetical protein